MEWRLGWRRPARCQPLTFKGSPNLSSGQLSICPTFEFGSGFQGFRIGLLD